MTLKEMNSYSNIFHLKNDGRDYREVGSKRGSRIQKDMKMLVEIAKQAKKEREAEALRTKRNESMGKAKKNMENFLDPDFFEDIVEPLDELDGEPPCSGNFQPAY